MKYKATKKFLELGIENSYQGLITNEYFDLRAGAEVELRKVPKHLLEGKYIEEVKPKKGVKE